MNNRSKVIIRRCPRYDPTLIEKIIREGLEEFGLTPKIRGLVTIKPNVVLAHHKLAPSAFTRAEFLDGLLQVLNLQKESVSRIAVAEKCGAGVPTSRMFRRAGYYKLKKKHRVKFLPIEEAKKKTIALEKGKIHKKIRTAREIVDSDFLVYAPKLKTNVLSQGLTGAIKLNMGILLDRQRMWNHNFNLDEKIVDLLEIGFPDFIATDAIETATGGNQFTQHGRHLGLVIMADNPLAHDVVCAHIFHLDPTRINHLRLAHERGYGPLSLEEIDIKGDISLPEIRQKTKGWETGLLKVDDVEGNIKVLSGDPYCVGGCHGVFLDWLYMIKDRKSDLWKDLPHWTVVIGKYKKDVSAEKLMIIGSCSEIQGEIKARKRRSIRGCPPKHKDLILKLLFKKHILNPMFRLDLIIDSYLFLFLSWCRRFFSGRF
ncbi:MAG: DUF362 domain-containing protein [Candidatus Aminicenantaceae bacterium]